ncbi:hypothetical protein C1I63_13155 [Rathayibacter caricis DSM 15933]|uniref:Rhamnosyl transferase n=1 Tax=Rathayibacter caricis DSM 15933 TaxID=1328867 RepID=A0A2T4UW11_9MICO|nr:glycosyltransferase [Rathayibacter caricis]PTL73693.1 hypothetical protein C1I63_13155 [Rathayibacter caricis DSM 15933]
MIPLEHVVLTRFSVVFTAGQPTPEDAWLRYRLGFFRDATVASLRSQTSTGSSWLVFLDDRAPDWLRSEMAELSSDGLFDAVYVRGPFSAEVVRAEIVQRVDPAAALLTTRLDSDDALGRRFVETVRREASAALVQGVGEDGLSLNCTRGLQIDRSGAVFRYDYASNPFISLLEPPRGALGPRTVLQDGRHSSSRLHAPVRSIRAEPLWLQVVHGSNLMNDIRGVRIGPAAVDRSFGIDLEYRRSTGAALLAGESLLSRLALLRLWWRSPGLARQFAEGRLEWLRGTRTAPRRPPRSRSRRYPGSHG